MKFRAWFERLNLSKRMHREWGVLLANPPSPESSLRDRMQWLEELFRKVFARNFLVPGGESIKPRARLKYCLMLLDRNPEWRGPLARTLSSLLLETSFVELVAGERNSTEFSVASSLWSRLAKKFVLEAPMDSNFNQVLRHFISKEEDISWILDSDYSIFDRILQLLKENEPAWKKIESKFFLEAQFALKILVQQSVTLGLNLVREKAEVLSWERTERFLELSHRGAMIPKLTDATSLRPEVSLGLFSDLEMCQRVVEEMESELESTGISLNRVNQIQILSRLLARMKEITSVLVRNENGFRHFSILLAGIFRESQRSSGLSFFLSDTTQILARRISETNAEIGDHYIVRNREDARELFWAGIGGGAIVAFTALAKMWSSQRLVGFLLGLFNGLNYSASFLLIHFLGFSLGTKQPAMTAHALSGKVADSLKLQDSVMLKREMREIVYSQSLSVLGNLFAVFPLVILTQVLMGFMGSKGISDEQSEYIFHSLSPFGGTLIFAAFTGLLLWLSSLSAGWAQNWFRLRNQFEAVSHQRHLIALVGLDGARNLAAFFRRNISTIVGNFSLGMSLGILPSVFSFLNIGLDVRHVTLSAANLALAVFHVGPRVMYETDLYIAIAGICLIGLLNIGISFGIAFAVALRSRQIGISDRRWLYAEIFPLVRRFQKKPAPEATVE